MTFEKEIKERELLEEKAEKKGWIVKKGYIATEKPIGYYLTKKEYKRWQQLCLNLKYSDSKVETIQEYKKRVSDVFKEIKDLIEDYFLRDDMPNRSEDIKKIIEKKEKELNLK